MAFSQRSHEAVSLALPTFKLLIPSPLEGSLDFRACGPAGAKEVRFTTNPAVKATVNMASSKENNFVGNLVIASVFTLLGAPATIWGAQRGFENNTIPLIFSIIGVRTHLSALAFSESRLTINTDI